MNEQPDVRAGRLVKVPAVHGLAQVDSTVADAQDVACEMFS